MWQHGPKGPSLKGPSLKTPSLSAPHIPHSSMDPLSRQEAGMLNNPLADKAKETMLSALANRRKKLEGFADKIK